MLKLLLATLIIASSATNTCMTISNVQTVVDKISSYNSNFTLNDIFSLNQSVTNFYKMIPKLGNYKIEIEDNYLITAAGNM